MLRWLADFVWPTLEPLAPVVASVEHHSTADDLEIIKSCARKPNAERALEEAKYLVDGELERRRNTEAKASTYLLVTAALVPILTYLEGAVWERKAGTAPTWLSVPVLLFAVASLVNAGRWAFKTLKVSASSAIDSVDLARIWGEADPVSALTALYLTISRRNRDGVNFKVSCMLMSHSFLLRSFVSFGLLLVIEAGWELWTSLSEAGPALPGGH